MESAIAELSPPLADWRVVPERWFDPTRSEAFTNEFSRKLSLFGDEHLLQSLVTRSAVANVFLPWWGRRTSSCKGTR